MRGLAKIMASPLEMLALFSSDFAHWMCNFIDYGIIHIVCAHVGHFFIGYLLEMQALTCKDAEG